MIGKILDSITSITMDDIILTILGLDTLRFVIASLGIVKRDTKFIGRLIYGKYDVVVVEEALRELGYSAQEATNIKKKLKHVAKEEKYPEADTPLKLLYVLSKYIIKFENVISYGLISEGKTLSYSNYYINTMEAVHNMSDLKELSHIMIRLMKFNKEERIDFVVVPKGGNPLLAQYIANELGVNLIISKDMNDSARPQEREEIERIGRIQYEGLDMLLDKQSKEKLRGVILDCNTSGGTQLVTVASDFNALVRNCDLNIEIISSCYVLFKLVKIDVKTEREIDIDKRFSDINCKLYRVFDLDEEDKKDLCEISYMDYYEAYSAGVLSELRNKIRSKSRCYYDK